MGTLIGSKEHEHTTRWGGRPSVASVQILADSPFVPSSPKHSPLGMARLMPCTAALGGRTV